jgi:hypothetical protein
MRVPSGFGIGVLAVTLSALLAASASAQVDTGSITGTVKDQSGAVVPGATVTSRTKVGLTLTSVTREDGTYIFTPIRTGPYRIDVELQGFKKEARRGITVGIQEQVRADFVLQAGGISEEVLVTGASLLLQTGSGTVGETFKSESLKTLPVNGRDYTVIASMGHIRDLPKSKLGVDVDDDFAEE